MLVTVNRSTLSAVTLLLLCRSALAASSIDSTQITIRGDILETPCTIAPDSVDQTIEMGVIPLSTLSVHGSGKPVPFTLRLEGCTLQRVDPHRPEWQRFIVTFAGSADGSDFALQGDARGAALRIADRDGNVSQPGVPLPTYPLAAGENALHYTLQLIRDHHAVQEGSYHSVISFRLNYF